MSIKNVLEVLSFMSRHAGRLDGELVRRTQDVRKMCRILQVILFISGMVPALTAQQLITAFSVEQGLPQSTVTALYRDNEGYLWCGTGRGLGLYDGWEFHTPKQSKEKPNPSLNSIVRGIIPSSDQRTIWAGSESTVNQFDRFSYRLIRSFDIIKMPGIAENPVVANDTAVWVVVCSKGLFRVRINDGKATQLTMSGYEGGRAAVSEDGRVIMFTDTTDHLVAYDIMANQIQIAVLPSVISADGLFSIRTNPLNQQGAFLFTSKGVWEFDRNKNAIRRYSLGDPNYVDSLMDFRTMDTHPDGSWWFGVMGYGVLRYDPSLHELRRCAWQQDGTFAGKLMAAPTSIICDDYGVVWCGTDGLGLIKLLHNRVVFSDKYTHSLVTDTCNWFVRCFYEMNADKFLVGTFRGGIQVIDYKRNIIQRMTSGPLWENVTPFFITESGDGRLLVGTDKSLLLIDTVNWSTQVVKSELKLSDTRYTGFLKVANGDVLVYGNVGLGKLDLSAEPRWIKNETLPEASITNVIQLNDGRIIASTYYNGLYELTSNEVFVKAYDYEKSVGVPVSTSVHGMIERDNKLYLGTESGVFILNNNFVLERVLNVDSGISDNTVYGIEGLDNDMIVISTGHGITLYNAVTSQMKIFSGTDGLPSDECNSGALLYGKSKLLYIGTTSGFVRWDPAHAHSCFRESKILASYGDDEEESSGIIRTSIVRDYGSGPIALLVWVTDFAFPERTVLTHKLEGAVKTGISETGLRKLNYAALSDGFYSLVVSAHVPGCDPTGISKLLTIKIVPPFWMSGWFIAVTSMGIVVIITLILFIIMRLNYQRKIRKLKMQQELDRVRARISRDIHDEIGAGLTRIALSGDLMSQKVAAGEVTSEKLKWISGTARELSQSMKEVVWSVNPHYDSLDHMAAYFRSYVSGVAENADVRFVFVADEKLPAVPVNPETRRNFLLILKEAISNSVKYAEATELRLEIHWKDNEFSMIIADNGKGFDLHGPSGVNSNGIRNIRQRAEASGCMVTIASSQGKGTSIRVQGPVS